MAFTNTHRIVCLPREEVQYDAMKSHHRWQSIGYYLFDTVLLSNQINAKTEIAGFVRCDSSRSLILTFSKMAKAFPSFDVVHYNGSHIGK